MQIFRHVQLVILAAECKNLDRGSSSSGRAVKILSGHPPVLKVYMCKFSDLCYFYFRLRRVKQVCCSVHYNSDNMKTFIWHRAEPYVTKWLIFAINNASLQVVHLQYF